MSIVFGRKYIFYDDKAYGALLDRKRLDRIVRCDSLASCAHFEKNEKLLVVALFCLKNRPAILEAVS